METTWWQKHLIERLKETNQEKKKLPVAEIVHFKDACIWSQEKIIAGMELRSYKR
jgi:hypothetical protein